MHIRYACMFWRKMMRMRKLKGLTIVLLAMMISVLLFGLVACGTNDSGSTTNPVIPESTIRKRSVRNRRGRCSKKQHSPRLRTRKIRDT